MNQIPANQEHKEAEQAEMNKKRDDFISSLSEADQKKFKAVEKASKLLCKEGVPFYLFPMLPSLEYQGKEQVWQWNSLASLMEYDKSGKPTLESQEFTKKFHEAFFAFLFNQFNGMMNGDTIEEKMQSMPFLFYTCLFNHHQYLNGKQPDAK